MASSGVTSRLSKAGADGVVSRARYDPIAQDRIFVRVGFETLAAFMSELRRGLEQNQALIRIEEIKAAVELIMSEGEKIQDQGFRAKGEFKSSFAIGIAVAIAGVAAGFREDRHDIVAEGKSFGGVSPRGKEAHNGDSPNTSPYDFCAFFPAHSQTIANLRFKDQMVILVIAVLSSAGLGRQNPKLEIRGDTDNISDE